MRRSGAGRAILIVSAEIEAVEPVVTGSAVPGSVLVEASVARASSRRDLDTLHMGARSTPRCGSREYSSLGNRRFRHGVFTRPPPSRRGYGLKFEWTERGACGASFHGLSVAHATNAREDHGTHTSAPSRCPLGSGCSVTAGRKAPIDTQWLHPLEGLRMGRVGLGGPMACC